MNRKVFTYNINKIGIDLDSVLCFYIDGEIDTYNGKNTEYLNILIGNNQSKPHNIKLPYITYYSSLSNKFDDNKENTVINKDVDLIYKELIEKFENK